jgi:hypothetical protein
MSATVSHDTLSLSFLGEKSCLLELEHNRQVHYQYQSYNYSTSTPIHTVRPLFTVSVSDSCPYSLSVVFPRLSAAMSIRPLPLIGVRSYIG